MLQNTRVARTGFELPRENPVKTAIPNHGGPEYGALRIRPTQCTTLRTGPTASNAHSGLAWPDLPATLKAGIPAMVESCTDR